MTMANEQERDRMVKRIQELEDAIDNCYRGNVDLQTCWELCEEKEMAFLELQRLDGSSLA